jgi:hypothetical protein
MRHVLWLVARDGTQWWHRDCWPHITYNKQRRFWVNWMLCHNYRGMFLWHASVLLKIYFNPNSSFISCAALLIHQLADLWWISAEGLYQLFQYFDTKNMWEALIWGILKLHLCMQICSKVPMIWDKIFSYLSKLWKSHKIFNVLMCLTFFYTPCVKTWPSKIGR